LDVVLSTTFFFFPLAFGACIPQPFVIDDTFQPFASVNPSALKISEELNQNYIDPEPLFISYIIYLGVFQV